MSDSNIGFDAWMSMKAERDALAAQVREMQSVLHGYEMHTERLHCSCYKCLAAELVEVRSDRQREHDLRVKLAGEAEANRDTATARMLARIAKTNEEFSV